MTIVVDSARLIDTERFQIGLRASLDGDESGRTSLFETFFPADVAASTPLDELVAQTYALAKDQFAAFETAVVKQPVEILVPETFVGTLVDVESPIVKGAVTKKEADDAQRKLAQVLVGDVGVGVGVVGIPGKK